MTTKRSHAVKLLDELIGQEKTFGRMLEGFRKADGSTQADFAKKLKISKQHLCDIEKGRKFVSPERAAKFAAILGHSVKGFVALALQDIVTRSVLPYRVRLEVT